MVKHIEDAKRAKQGIVRVLLHNLKWFLISAVVVVVMAVMMSYLPHNELGQNALSAAIQEHLYLWVAIRALIVIGFVVVWPYLIRGWSKKYAWPQEYVGALIQRRWRYAVWLIVIDVVFQWL